MSTKCGGSSRDKLLKEADILYDKLRDKYGNKVLSVGISFIEPVLVIYCSSKNFTDELLNKEFPDNFDEKTGNKIKVSYLLTDVDRKFIFSYSHKRNENYR